MAPKYTLREELLDFYHSVESNLVRTAVKSVPDSPPEKTPRTDLQAVLKPRGAYTLGIRRVSVANLVKKKVGDVTEEISLQCKIEHIPLGNKRRGKVVHSPEITGEDGKFVSGILCRVGRIIEKREAYGKQYYFPTKVYTPGDKVVKRYGSQVIQGQPNIYGDAPINRDWNHEDQTELPEYAALYRDARCTVPDFFPYADVMENVLSMISASGNNAPFPNIQDIFDSPDTKLSSGSTTNDRKRKRPVCDSDPDTNSDSEPAPRAQCSKTSDTNQIQPNPVWHIYSQSKCFSYVEGPSSSGASPSNSICTCGRPRASQTPPVSPPFSGFPGQGPPSRGPNYCPSGLPTPDQSPEPTDFNGPDSRGRKRAKLSQSPTSSGIAASVQPTSETAIEQEPNEEALNPIARVRLTVHTPNPGEGDGEEATSAEERTQESSPDQERTEDRADEEGDENNDNGETSEDH
ncbi:hypothetical protein TWF281_002956 [Arthrobotrys megalospora]